ncbi:MAG TPA: hypothetical protein VFV93_12965, partial [Thermomicrobiales bacterium]|nr:hypothetical protein [Thermomicrobiales bacterium]
MAEPPSKDSHVTWRGSSGILRVLLIGLCSGALYLAVYLLQRGIYLNGLASELGQPADRGRLALQAALYVGCTIALFALYGWLLMLCHGGQLSDGRVRRLALALPVLFNLGLLFGRPYLSTDLFTYLAHGKLSLLDAGNPYVHQPTEVEQLPFGLDLL